MAKLPLILLLTDDDRRRENWSQILADGAIVCSPLPPPQTGEMDVPEVIVTDQLPLTHELGPAARRLACGEVGLLGVGTHGAGDVMLPEDCTGRELQLACRLLVEVVHLRRRLAEEVQTQRALRAMAYRDPLTGLANRRQWDQQLVAHMQRLETIPTVATLAIVLLDMDHFKPINDRLGHVAGDLVLQRVAHRLAANVASQHVVARWGGDEFGILLSGLLAADVPEVVETIRRSIEDQQEVPGQVESPITASAGVAILQTPTRLKPLEALSIADQALQDAKQQGRSRTVARHVGGSQGSCE